MQRAGGCLADGRGVQTKGSPRRASQRSTRVNGQRPHLGVVVDGGQRGAHGCEQVLWRAAAHAHAGAHTHPLPAHALLPQTSPRQAAGFRTCLILAMIRISHLDAHGLQVDEVGQLLGRGRNAARVLKGAAHRADNWQCRSEPCSARLGLACSHTRALPSPSHKPRLSSAREEAHGACRTATTRS